MRWVGHVALMGEKRIYADFWWEDVKEEGHLEHLDVDVRILKWILQH
jgi:hypothetical protein